MTQKLHDYIRGVGKEDAHDCMKAGGSREDCGFCCSYKRPAYQALYEEGWFDFWDALELRARKLRTPPAKENP